MYALFIDAVPYRLLRWGQPASAASEANAMSPAARCEVINEM